MRLTETVVHELPIPERGSREYTDDQTEGLALRVTAAGRRTWYFRYRFDGAVKRYPIGTVGSVSRTQARRRAKTLSGKVALGIDPVADKRRHREEAERAKHRTLRGFLDAKYGPWVTQERKSGDATLSRILKAFAPMLERELLRLTPEVLDTWRLERRKQGRAPSTINRDVGALKACLSKAVEWRVIDVHPLAKYKPLKEDKSRPRRFLSADEEKRLRRAIRDRDAHVRERRERFNAWRSARAYSSLANYGAFVDHLEPVVRLALGTGMRLGEILQLRWSNIDWGRSIIHVRGENTKTAQSRVIPMNREARCVLERWHSESEWVFPNDHEAPLGSIKNSWNKLRKEAELPKLRFHDLRHTVARRLVVERGVDLETARQLLGHMKISTTALYLDSDEAKMREAVELL